jgi:hypothetical protein
MERLSFSKYRSTRMERVNNDLTCELKLQEIAKRHSLLSRRLFIWGLNKGDRKLWKICYDLSYCCFNKNCKTTWTLKCINVHKNYIFYLQFSSILDKVVDKDSVSDHTIPSASLNLVSKHLFNNG